MIDPRIRKWAQVMTEYSAPIKPGDLVMIQGSPLGEPLILELARAVLERGGLPHLWVTPTQYQEVFYRHASDLALDTVSPLKQYEYEHLDVIFNVLSEGNTRAMTGVDPTRVVRFQRTYQPISELYMRRAAVGELLWCLTLFPTTAYAQDAEMSLSDLSEFIFQACFLNEPDPVQRWRDLWQRQQVLVDALDAAHELQIRAPGTDLRVGFAGRKWINSDGTHNFPSGEVFTGPIESQVDGQVSFGFPGVYNGREVRGVQLWFEAGKVVKASAEHNEAFLLEMLDTDEGARYLGEVAFGTNYAIQRFMRNTLFDEKIGGTMHLALGRSYPETGGQNVSAIHWDLVCDLRQEGEVLVDRALFQQNGRFVMLDGGVV